MCSTMGPAPRRCARSCRSKFSRAPSFRASIASVRRARACATSSGSSLGGGGCDPAGASVLIVVVVIVIIVVVDEPRASARTSQSSHSAHCSAAGAAATSQLGGSWSLSVPRVAPWPAGRGVRWRGWRLRGAALSRSRPACPPRACAGKVPFDQYLKNHVSPYTRP